MKRDRFYKTSPHGDVGSNLSFHVKDGNGYSTNLNDAHVYTREEAQGEVDKGWLRTSNTEELFLSADHVDELAVKKVDCQYVKCFYPENKDSNNEYVIYIKGHWDGNDLGFVSDLHYNYDYSKARVFKEEDLASLELDNYCVIPKSHADEISRKTFQSSNINRRKMISGAGITGILKKKVSNKSGKVRWNCPHCGKIAWQENPYDFETCSDVSCKGYNFNFNYY